MFSVSSSGDFSKTLKFLQQMQKIDSTLARICETEAQKGVHALIASTPRDSGLAANSWGYKIEHSAGKVLIGWTNSDVENGFPVALMIQYGHGTGTGGYIQGRDYINPAMRPVFDGIRDAVWKAVTSA
jgi:hypothetical protein